MKVHDNRLPVLILTGLLVIGFLPRAYGQRSLISTAKKKNVPKTAEELATWLGGTEWRVRETRGKQQLYVVRRFNMDGTMVSQEGRKEWYDKEKPTRTVKYLILDEKTVQYGLMKWVVEFKSDYRGFSGEPMDPDEYVSKEKKAGGKKKKKKGLGPRKQNKRKNSKCTGYFVRRFTSSR